MAERKLELLPRKTENCSKTKDWELTFASGQLIINYENNGNDDKFYFIGIPRFNVCTENTVSLSQGFEIMEHKILSMIRKIWI